MGAGEQSRRRARPVLTGRALVLGGIMVLLVVLLASPIHRYLASRSAISAASAQLQQDRQTLQELRKQKERWGDPGYIQQQARARLQFAMPGDVVYVTVDKGEASDIEKTAGPVSDVARAGGWNTRLWDSVLAAAK
jgi:cell division protein FtsB